MSGNASVPVLRVARPANDLAALQRFYGDAAGFAVLGSFDGHDGFDGLILGYPGAGWHLELVREHGTSAARAAGEEHLLVLYLPDAERWQAAVSRMESHGFRPVRSNNPYWDRRGRTFEDPEGYRLVLQNAAWPLDPPQAHSE
ncbi:Glyoxalase/Bleomycin resistance protein/Dioxygenase superfamily protein [Faunimonas pinastri]|uniref:Glyoxalase/Bleomycin resistance protein/Dioxygenase superfamily protein n=1 Tax=Faunimonas pinastri TaxID=1855383 RepID=A0A1H9QI75_9HYPH|nr:VOC family protein [Faunimonas pinastri]SER60130.1 Glyoxalase/Bleomycin resistance protein/Dioxygenase superfamily protein [Faunimonas pinastri]